MKRNQDFAPRPTLHTRFFTVVGDDSLGGTYVLRLWVRGTVVVRFGRFKKGKLITVPAGECLYVGSALQGLGRRLARHATRSGTKAPHPIRAHMLDYFPSIGLGKGDLLPIKDKKLHWNIDHLLEHDMVELGHVFILRSSLRLENSLGQFLQQDPCTFILEKGLGAGDITGNTHILGVKSDESWWQSLPSRFETYFSPGKG